MQYRSCSMQYKSCSMQYKLLQQESRSTQGAWLNFVCTIPSVIQQYIQVAHGTMRTEKITLFISHPRSRGRKYCHHHVWPCVCVSFPDSISKTNTCSWIVFLFHTHIPQDVLFEGYDLGPNFLLLILRRLLTLIDDR